jgi:hypothetical protein
VSRRRIRFDLERAAISGYGFVDPAYLAVGFAKVGMSEVIVRIENDG